MICPMTWVPWQVQEKSPIFNFCILLWEVVGQLLTMSRIFMFWSWNWNLINSFEKWGQITSSCTIILGHSHQCQSWVAPVGSALLLISTCFKLSALKVKLIFLPFSLPLPAKCFQCTLSNFWFQLDGLFHSIQLFWQPWYRIGAPQPPFHLLTSYFP